MGQFTIGKFIVLDQDTKLCNLMVNRKTYEYADTGAIIYAIGVPIPLIIRGSGCYGLAMPVSFTVTENTTTVRFTLAGPSDHACAKAYMDLYRLSTGRDSDNSGHSFDIDVMIPGVVNAPRVNLAEKKNRIKKSNNLLDSILDKSSGKRATHSSIDEFDEDDDYYD